MTLKQMDLLSRYKDDMSNFCYGLFVILVTPNGDDTIDGDDDDDDDDDDDYTGDGDSDGVNQVNGASLKRVGRRRNSKATKSTMSFLS